MRSLTTIHNKLSKIYLQKTLKKSFIFIIAQEMPRKTYFQYPTHNQDFAYMIHIKPIYHKQNE